MKILTVLGARPQFVKASVVCRAVSEWNKKAAAGSRLNEILIHTGQHFDVNMSDVFFSELSIPEPKYHLGVKGGLHGASTGQMLERLEKTFIEESPDFVMVYGDTNSTLAGALAAAKLHLPIAHVEAGLRSFNRKMPEEVNRVLTDHLSALLFCPTQTSIKNLQNEGIKKGVHLVGDVMQDSVVLFGELAESKSRILETLKLSKKNFVLATIHRAENTDEPARLKDILTGLNEISRSTKVVFPVHPRTRAAAEKAGLQGLLKSLISVEPLSFMDTIMLQKSASAIVTDSGGIQKEAFFLRTPCITVRDQTEWVETVESGWNRLSATNPDAILATFKSIPEWKKSDSKPFGPPGASSRIVEILTSA